MFDWWRLKTRQNGVEDLTDDVVDPAIDSDRVSGEVLASGTTPAPGSVAAAIVTSDELMSWPRAPRPRLARRRTLRRQGRTTGDLMAELDIADCINDRCPWSGDPVAADSLTTYNGHVVGFCNPGCRDKFEAAVARFDELLTSR